MFWGGCTRLRPKLHLSLAVFSRWIPQKSHKETCRCCFRNRCLEHKCGKTTRPSLVSVLTAAEGHGLGPMAAGLMKRYQEAGETAPKVMYMDRDCCSQHGPSLVIMFSEWDELVVRLDIWHFMWRFATGVMTEAHPLYWIFMAHLSTCIFQWDPEAVAALRRPKEGDLAAKKTGHISEKCGWEGHFGPRMDPADMEGAAEAHVVYPRPRELSALHEDGSEERQCGAVLLQEPVPVMRIFRPISLRA